MQVFELHENSILSIDLLWIRTNFKLKLQITATSN